jgi:16S rRNA (cytosine1402-N4)-methyltransferase
VTASDAVTGRWDTSYHAPVMVEEVLKVLGGSRQALDCTLGGGGHSEALLAAGATVTALDQDEAAIDEARKRLAAHEAAGRFRALRGNFSDIDQLPELQHSQFDAILADLGVSSHQIDSGERGFSFRPGTLLDMRMDSRSTTTAADLLNTLDEADLTRLFREFGDEPRASRLARGILRRRESKPMKISDDLVDAIRGSFGPRSGPADFARLFQAVRIAVNDELAALERALPLLRNRLGPNGVLAVIAYHSGEDRIVKNAMRDWSRDCVCPPKQLQCTCGGRNSLGDLVTRKAIKASAQEIAKNPRSRSARLRAWRRAA